MTHPLRLYGRIRYRLQDRSRRRSALQMSVCRFWPLR
jgi:hypothetical protein